MISRDDRAAFNEQLRVRRRGRPRRQYETVKANVRLSASVYDALCRQALSERVSLHFVLQRELTRAATRPALS